MRVEGVVLEHHRHVAVLGILAGDVGLADADRTLVDLLETGEHPQRGGLAAPRGTHEDEELAVVDLEVEVVHGGTLAPGKRACGLVERDGGHRDSFYRQERAGRSEWK